MARHVFGYRRVFEGDSDPDQKDYWNDPGPLGYGQAGAAGVGTGAVYGGPAASTGPVGGQVYGQQYGYPQQTQQQIYGQQPQQQYAYPVGTQAVPQHATL